MNNNSIGYLFSEAKKFIDNDETSTYNNDKQNEQQTVSEILSNAFNNNN